MDSDDFEVNTLDESEDEQPVAIKNESQKDAKKDITEDDDLKVLIYRNRNK